jgi:tRNA(adenine34) deaminase
MLQLTPDFVDYLMQEALAQAAAAAAINEVPVGAVIAHGGQIIASGHNTTEVDTSVIAHAELHAITAATKILNNWRLTESVLCVTLEPCTMCLGAIRLARIPTIIFGAGDSKQGAVGSLYDLSQDTRLGAAVRVIRGIRSAECESLLRDFFQRSRMTKKRGG